MKDNIDAALDYSYGYTRERIGDYAQIASVRPVRLEDGHEYGTRAIDVRIAGGLHVLVLADRGMDLGAAWYAGHPLAWISPTGVTRPAVGPDNDFLRLFHGGLLVTAGLQNVGLPSDVEGAHHGLHGKISLTPARNVSWRVQESLGLVEVTGTVREVSVHGADLELRRTLVFKVGHPIVRIYDTVENRGFGSAPLFILYHFNIGYPVVDNHARFFAPERSTIPFDDASTPATSEHDRITAPNAKAGVEIFEHVLNDKARSRVTAGVVNQHFTPTSGIGVAVSYKTQQLPRLWQWRMLNRGRYLIGVEPANCGLHGRAAADPSTVDVLEPGATRDFELGVEVLTGSATQTLARP